MTSCISDIQESRSRVHIGIGNNNHDIGVCGEGIDERRES